LSQELRDKIAELRLDLHNLEMQLAPGALQPALTRLEELERSVSAGQEQSSWFIAHVSHELRVPMTSILGYTDLLRKGIGGPVNEQQLGFLSVIRNNIERMATLISDLSDLSKAEAGSLRLEVAGVSLKPVIEEVVRSTKTYFGEKDQVFTIDLPDDLPQVSADPRRLAQVLVRLLANASRYTARAGQISLRVYHQPPVLRFIVADTGIGISPEDQDCLFSQFFRSEHAYVREQSGWGLSLSVIKVLVEHMGGSVGASSTLESGSEFWITLPVFAE
jgi:signal transduction histidine kinase